jgi:hypothetical protein
MSRVRKWNGKPSVTQLINGVMLEYLKIKHDYYENPLSMSYRIMGTKAHSGLEAQDDELSILEEQFGEGEDMTGKPDALEVEGGKHILIDHKLTGHFKVLKALGIKKFEIPTGELYKSGAKKGQPKMAIIRRKTDDADMFEWELQLNRYRIYFEKAGFKVDEMRIEAFLRDFNFVKNVKIENYEVKPIEFFEVKRLPDSDVIAYFAEKREALLRAIKGDSWDEPCSPRERWENDRRCEDYCPVNGFCPYWIDQIAKRSAFEDKAGAITGQIEAMSDEARELLEKDSVGIN